MAEIEPPRLGAQDRCKWQAIRSYVAICGFSSIRKLSSIREFF